HVEHAVDDVDVDVLRAQRDTDLLRALQDPLADAPEAVAAFESAEAALLGPELRRLRPGDLVHDVRHLEPAVGGDREVVDAVDHADDHEQGDEPPHWALPAFGQ